MNLLQIDSSVLGTRSATRELTAALVRRWRLYHPGTTVVQRDLDAAPLPHLTAASLARSDAVETALAEIVMQEFLAADVLVIGAPMYNFSVPSTLKAWIDRIAVAGRTFRYTANGPEGLARGKTVIVASARGSALGDASPADFQEGYLRQVFGFLGITDIRFVRAEGVGLSPEHRANAMLQAHATIERSLPLAA